MVGCLRIGVVWLRMIDDDSNVDGHVIPEILVSRNENVAVFVFKAESTRSTLIEAVEVFHGSDDGIGGVVWKNLYFKWKSRSVIRCAIEQQLEGYCFRSWTRR